MKTPVKSYESLWERFPGKVNTCIKLLKEGKAKAKNDPPESFMWTFEWGVEIPSFTAKQLFVITSTPRTKKYFVWLSMDKGRAHSAIAFDDGVIPEEVQAEIDAWEKKDADEKARIAAQTPEERAAEQAEIIDILHKAGGFVALRGPK